MSPSRSAWPTWLGLWLLATGSAVPTAALHPVVDKEWGPEVVRRVEKVHVTTELQLLRRAKASSTCPTNYSLCPASMSGGCCPTQYACATDSCVQTSVATTVSACGRAGYINCGLEAGGGCCPSGYVCGVNDCTAPAGVSNTQQCPTGYYLCPASYNYGCCQTTMGCALNACYVTTPSTLVFTATFTTSTDAHGNAMIATVTETTVEIPIAPSGLPADTNIYFPKFIVATQAKVQEVAVVNNSTSSDSSSGLTSAQIGGLIGGLVGLLVVILVAAFFIIRSLRRTAQAVKRAERNNAASSGGRRNRKSGGGGGGGGEVSGSGESGIRSSKKRMAPHLPTPSEVNRMEYDELLENETAQTQVGGQPYVQPNVQNLGNVTGTASPDPHGYAKTSLDYSSPSVAMERTPMTGSFDIPPRVQNRPGRYSNSTDPRTSMDSQGQQPVVWQQQQQQQQYQRSRITSDASERSAGESAGVGSPLQPAELGVEGGFIPELPSVLQSPTESPGENAQFSSQYGQYPGQAQVPQRSRPFSSISAMSGMSALGANAQVQQQQYQQQQQPLMGHSRNWSDDSINNGTLSHTPGHTPGNTPGHTPSHSRDRSNSYQLAQHQQQAAPKLDAVSEVAEHMHGHYGPANVVAGQTRADADVDIDISSPVAP